MLCRGVQGLLTIYSELNSSGTRTGKEPSTESMALVKADPESETEPQVSSRLIRTVQGLLTTYRVLKAWGKRTEKEPFPEAMHPVKKPKTETKEP